MPKTKHVTIYILYLSLIVLIASACGDSKTTDLRVVHASPDAPPVDVYIVGQSTPTFEDLSYGEASEYNSIDSGVTAFEIRPAGAPSDSEPVLTQEDVFVEGDGRLTGVIAGLIESDAPGSRARLELFREEFQAAESGVARVRVVHVSPDVQSVAIDLNDDGSREVENLARFSATEEVGIEVPAGMPFDIGIWAGEPLQRVTTFTVPALEEGDEAFVFASGLSERLPREEAGFQLLVVGPSGPADMIQQNPAIMALHGIPDAAPVDIYDGNETLLASNVSFGTLSEPIRAKAGELELNVIEAGQPATSMPIATFTPPALEAGNRYLATVAGLQTVPGSEVQLFVTEEDFAVEHSSNAQFSFLHASPDAPALDVSTVANDLLTLPALVTNLGFGKPPAQEGSVTLPPDTYMMGVAPATTREPIGTFELEANAGMREFAVFLGLLFPGEFEPLGAYLIDTTVFPWTIRSIQLAVADQDPDQDPGQDPDLDQDPN